MALTDATTTSDVLTADFAHGTREVVVASDHLADTERAPARTANHSPSGSTWRRRTATGIQAVPTDADLDDPAEP